MPTPLVSVIIPNYNHAAFLRQRIDSVLGQTLKDIEVVLMDDASTDNSIEIIESYRGDPRIRLHYNQVNSGNVFKQWNRGLAQASGEFVWIAESDDYADPTLLEKLVGRLRENPRAGLAYCQSYKVEEDTPRLDPAHWYGPEAPRWTQDYSSSGVAEIRHHLVRRNTVPNASAAVFRRSVALKAGPADESFRLSADWLFWIRLLGVSDVEYVSEPLNYYRFHANTTRNRHSRDGTMVEEALRISGYVLRTHPVPKSLAAQIQADLNAWFISTLLSGGDHLQPAQRKRILEEASRVDPWARPRYWARRSGLSWLWLGIRRRLTGAPRRESI